MGTLKYPSEGKAKVFGDEHHRLVVESTTKPVRNWKALESVAISALRDGFATLELSSHEVFWAYQKAHEKEFHKNLKSRFGESASVFLGTTLGLMNRKDGLFPSPAIWRVSEEVRFAVMEEDVIIAHALDATAFEYSDNGRSLRIAEPLEAYPVYATIDGTLYPLTLRFVYDALYGYETIENCGQGILEIALDIHRMPEPELDVLPTSKPSVHAINSSSDMAAIVNNQDILNTDLAAIYPSVQVSLMSAAPVWQKLLDPETRDDKRGAYSVMTIGDLRKVVAASETEVVSFV